MVVGRIFDLVRGTEIALSLSPDAGLGGPEAGRPRWNIVRPDPGAAALVAKHLRALEARRVKPVR